MAGLASVLSERLLGWASPVIFVTVGNGTQPSRRLLDAIESLAGESAFSEEEFVVQSGYNREVRSTRCRQVDFLPPQEFSRLIAEAHVVVCHGGAGTLWHAFQAGKCPVVMPRRTQYGETRDDQLELVRTLALEGRVIPAYEPEDLPTALARARSTFGHPSVAVPSRLLSCVGAAIEELIGAAE